MTLAREQTQSTQSRETNRQLSLPTLKKGALSTNSMNFPGKTANILQLTCSATAKILNGSLQ